MTDYEQVCSNIVKIFSYYLGAPLNIRGNDTYFKCHSCGGDKLSVSQTKGVAHCWKCGWSGNSVTLIQELDNLTVRDAIKHGAQLLGTIPLSKFITNDITVINNNKEFTIGNLGSLKKAIYLQIFSFLLKNMSEEDVLLLKDIIFNNVPDTYFEKLDIVLSNPDRNIAEYMLTYYPLNILQSCPGFVCTNGKLTFTLNDHIIFTYWSSDRTEILGFNGRRKDNNPKYPRYKWLVGEKKHLYYPPTVTDKNFVIITEGEKKAIAATSLGIPSIAVSGVECYNTHELRKNNIGGREIFICYDRDKDNKAVRKAEEKLSKYLGSKGAKPRVINLPVGYKLDDYLKDYSKENLEKLMEEAV